MFNSIQLPGPPSRANNTTTHLRYDGGGDPPLELTTPPLTLGMMVVETMFNSIQLLGPPSRANSTNTHLRYDGGGDHV